MNPAERVWIPVLCYHRVCPVFERGIDSPSLCVTPDQFKRQLRLLKFLGYRSITPQDLVAYRQSRKNPPRKSALLTFDDGYEDNYLYAFPLLKQFSMTATLFLVTDSIGKKNGWDSGSLSLLNESQIEEMHLSGIQFGSHTAGHLDLSQADSEVTKRELLVSKEKVQDLTSRLDIPFCYPYSRLNSQSKQLVKDAGYSCAFAGDRNFEEGEDIFDLMRIQVFPSTSLLGFWKKLQPWYPAWYRFQKGIKKSG
ncbi:MAG: polysaccharide deacetylase family protein [Elusimicrobia bacterium]|nr:polysaccharide deacetylase family protein [Elusimicrobiota bacterium]